MRQIGFVRHFKVLHRPDSRWMTSGQFDEWVERYDRADLKVQWSAAEVSEFAWEACYCSHLSRATRTAEVIYKGKTIVTEQLREIGLRAFLPAGIKLPLTLWLLLARLAWHVSHRSQEESKEQTLCRARQFIDTIETAHKEDSPILIVSHGAFIKVLAKELRRRGYKGRTDIVPKNGKLYSYVKRETTIDD